tara:strand:+ start:682 stop:2367 length:1686 start_codon:yes stop_codon:yes gene_type:complete
VLQKKWIYKPLVDAEKVKYFCDEWQMPKLLAEVICSRGFDTREAVESFLFPDLRQLRDPYMLRNMHEAVFLLQDCIKKKRRIIILGDYDVDGITATAMMVEFLRKCGVENLDYFIPNRLKHGYGLTEASTKILLEMKPDLVITVDNGITAFREVKRLKNEGVSTIVTDHHLADNQMVPSGIVVNPNHPECNYPFKEISGCGVALKVIMALRKLFRESGFWNDKRPEPNLLESLDLVAMGTVADVVSLLDENRVLTYYGLNIMNEKPRISVKVLKKLKKVDRITSRSIGFQFAPLLNAAGRLKDANIAVEFLLSEDEQEAMNIAKILDEANRERRRRESEMLEDALLISEKQTNDPALILTSPSFHEGINGLVATRLMERYYKPVIILTEYTKKLKGSGRSIPELNLKNALSECGELLERFGGHSAAAGCSLLPKNLNAFRERFFSVCKELIPAKIEPKIEIDGFLELTKLSEKFVEQIDRLQPFGEGNQEPIFEIIAPKKPFKLLKKKHVKWNISDDFDILGWDLANSFLKNPPSKLVVNLGFNEFAGSRKIQMTIKDSLK